MTATGILSALLIGVVIGTLGRLILPGRQSIGVVSTVAVGVVAALLGTWAARYFGVADEWPAAWDAFGRHWTWSWAELCIQLAFAVVGIAIAAALTNTIIADRPNRPARTSKRRS